MNKSELHLSLIEHSFRPMETMGDDVETWTDGIYIVSVGVGGTNACAIGREDRASGRMVSRMECLEWVEGR
jgi:hypothetical protein